MTKGVFSKVWPVILFCGTVNFYFMIIYGIQTIFGYHTFLT